MQKGGPVSTSPAPRPHVSISQVRRAKARLNPSRPQRRVRAEEAVINQWLLEQSGAPARRGRRASHALKLFIALMRLSASSAATL